MHFSVDDGRAPGKSVPQKFREICEAHRDGGKSAKQVQVALRGFLMTTRSADEAWALVDMMVKEFHVPLSNPCAVPLVRRCGIDGSIARLGEITGLIRASGECPKQFVYTALIRAYGRAALADPAFVNDAKRCFREMIETDRLMPDDLCFSCMTETLLGAGLLDEAKRHYHDMRQARGTDPMTYAGHRGLAVAKTLTTFRLEPTVSNYLINQCANSDSPEDAIFFFDDMLPEHRNARCFNAVVRACRRGGNVDALERCYELAGQAGIQLDSEAFRSAMSACAHGPNPERAFVFFERMLKAGMAPSVDHFTQLLVACASRENSAAAMRVLADMQARQLEPNARCLEYAIRACVASRDDASADRVLALARALGAGMLASTFSAAVTSAQIHQLDEQADGYFRRMVKAGCTPDSNALQSMLIAAERLRDDQTVVNCFANLRKFADVRPAQSIFVLALRACARLGLGTLAEEWLVQLGESHPPLHAMDHGMVFNAHVQAGNASAALDHVRRMTVPPEPWMRAILVLAHVAEGKTGEAHALLDLMMCNLDCRAPKDVSQAALACVACGRDDLVATVIAAARSSGVAFDAECYNSMIENLPRQAHFGRIQSDETIDRHADALADRFLAMAVDTGVFRPELGWDARQDNQGARTLDLHLQELTTVPYSRSDVAATTPNLARALLRHHHRLGRIDDALWIVSGRGIGFIRATAFDFLTEIGREPLPQLRESSAFLSRSTLR